MLRGRASPRAPSALPTDGIDFGSSPDGGEVTCYEVEALATSSGETPHGGWPWPNVGPTVAPPGPPGSTGGPNSDGLWPTPVADGDRTTNYAQGGMSLGAAVRGNLDGRPTEGRSHEHTFPTPIASDAHPKGYGGPSLQRRVEKGKSISLAMHVKMEAPTFPTPTASDGAGGPGQAKTSEGGVNLRTAVATFPTPTSSMVTVGDMEQARFAGNGGKRPTYDEANRMWPTPMTSDANGVGGAASRKDGRQSMLHHAVKEESEPRSWPTPMAGPADVRDGGGHGGVKLALAATEEESGPDAPRGQLNPYWTEWLMGWPVGWTSLSPLTDIRSWDEGTRDLTWWRAEPEGVPRVEVGVEQRVARLKAIGNGQVPLCAASAALALAELFRQLDAAEAPEEPVDLLDFLGL